MIADISNHLWQSTLFGVAVGLLTVALRRHQARIRYGLWFSASLKFLVPLTPLIMFGRSVAWAPAAQQLTPPAVSSVVGQISQPFGGFSTVTATAAGTALSEGGTFAPAIVALVWISGTIALAATRVRLWRRVRGMMRASTPCHLPGVPPAVSVRSAPGLIEPGVIGWWRPVLLIPQGIAEHLTPPQLDAVLAHELCHIRRRDNLTSALHMAVETIFWFHPLVWWVGARLIEERERACDEEVLQRGGDPRTYADAILNVCRRYAESPLVCVSGVSGANLRNRIESIMLNRVGRRLHVATKVALAAGAVTLPIVPVLVGAMSPQATERFEVATIRPNHGPAQDGPVGGGIGVRGGRFLADNVTVQQLVSFAFDRQAYEVFGGPSWATSDRFDIVATMDPTPTPASDPAARHRRLARALLVERFRLVVHEERREMPVFALIPARSDRQLGDRLRPFQGECEDPIKPGAPAEPRNRRSPTPDASNGPPPCGASVGAGRLSARGMKLADLTFLLATFPAVSRRVIDRTGLTGRFDFDLEWTPMAFGPPASESANGRPDGGPTIFTALQEQLGLKLDPTKDAVAVLVIDTVDQPSAN